MIIKDDEFYGFLNGVDIIAAGKITEKLRDKSVSKIYEDDTNAEVVEEVVRRGGTFFDGIETKKIAPWAPMYTDVYSARFGYLEGETRPVNPALADFDWCVLGPVQYMYGKYLQAMIEKGELSVKDVVRRTK